MFIPRLSADPIRNACSLHPVVIVTGPRHCGKTTLLRAAFPEYRYVNLEESDSRRLFKDDPHGFLRQYDKFVLFDGVHRLPELLPFLRAKTEADNIMGQYLLASAQDFLMLGKIDPGLTEHWGVFRLLPLSHAELNAAGVELRPVEVQDAIFRGGYPALYDRNAPVARFFQNYMETCVERDARNALNIKDINSFQDFLRLCAGRVGQPLNLKSLALEAGISVPTVRNWLAILEAGFILFQLPPFIENFSKRLIKTPKLYFYDTGFLCHLLGLHEPGQVHQYFQRGVLFENMMIVEVLKNRLFAGRRPGLFFWQDSHKVEVDLVELDDADTHLYDMKYSYTPSADFFKGIRVFRTAAPDALKNGQNKVVYAGELSQARATAAIESWKGAPGL